MQREVHGKPAGGRFGLQGPAGPARQLTARRRAAPDDDRDFLEWVLEHVVQHERGPFRRTEALKEGMHGHGDVVDECHLTRRIERVHDS